GDQVARRVGVDLERAGGRAGRHRGGRRWAVAGVVWAGAAGLDRCRRPPAAATRRPRCELSGGSPHERRAPRTDGEFCYPSCRIDLLPIIPVAHGRAREPTWWHSALTRGKRPVGDEL